MRRLFDIIFSFTLLLVILFPLILIAVLIKISSQGPVVFWSDRIGKDNIVFKMPKLRTMKIHTPAVASNLISNPENYITKVGRILRYFSIDELPQFWCVLVGTMSIIGPRPALFNQTDLIDLRKKNNIHTIKPGITGWAQVNGRAEININEKVQLEVYYLENRSILLDLKILTLTVKKVLLRDNITH